MSGELYEKYRKKFSVKYLFPIMAGLSLFLHVGIYGAYYIYQNWKPDEVDSSTITQEVDMLEDIPPELLGGDKSPAPVEKKDWVEGTKKDGDAPDDSDIKDALSGNGTDKDGFMFAVHGDRVPTPIMDFDLKNYFPQAAKDANITDKQVILLVQIDEAGHLVSAKLVSGRAGYGFDDAAMQVIKLVRWVPGYVKGRPVKMTHRVPINFSLNE